MGVREKFLSKLEWIALLVLGLACASSCISEALFRNCTRVLVVCLIFSFVLNHQLLKRIAVIKTACISIFLWIFVQCISLLYSGHVAEYLDSNVFTMNYIVLLFIAGLMYVKSSKQAMNLLFIIFASVVVNDIYVFYQSLNGVHRPVALTAPAVIVPTMIYAITLPAMLVMVFHKELSNSKRFSAAVCAAMSMAGLICTNTRGAWIVVFPVLFIIAMYYIKTWQKRIGFSVACILLAGILLISFPSVLSRTNTIVHGSSENSVTERFRMWHSAYNMGMDNFIFGVGMGNYADKYQKEYISPVATEPTQRHAHNTFIQTFAEMGIIGELIYVFMVVSLVGIGVKKYKNYFGMAFLGGTVALLLYSLTDYTLAIYSAMRVYWLLAGICVAGIYLHEKQM